MHIFITFHGYSLDYVLDMPPNTIQCLTVFVKPSPFHPRLPEALHPFVLCVAEICTDGPQSVSAETNFWFSGIPCLNLQCK